MQIFKKFFNRRAKQTKLSADLIHDIRTPLANIRNCIDGVNGKIETLIKVYEIALASNLEIPELLPQELNALKKSLLLSKKDIYLANYFLDIFSLLSADVEVYKKEKILMEEFSIKEALQNSLYSYPTKNNYQNDLLKDCLLSEDFFICFNKRLFNAIIFLILQFSFKQIEKNNRGGSLSVSIKRDRTMLIDARFSIDEKKFIDDFKNSMWYSFCRNAIYGIGCLEIVPIKDGALFFLKFN